jgi:ABC-type spermidine/putrescine transport system permease subunit I
MIGNVIYEQAVARFNYSFAAAAAVITLLISLIAIVGVNKASQVLAGGRQ